MQKTVLRCNVIGSNNAKGFYNIFVKRILDIIISSIALILLSPILLLLAVLVKINLGSPIIFRQKRPGLNENVFEMYKFRTMTNARDKEGKLLSDEIRLTKFGKWLRSTSLDELPELLNVLKGDMSLVGPRPQLVRDMVFMTSVQRKRHLVKPGITGLAQISGRNAISWEKKLEIDLKYIERISLINDIWILYKTVEKVLKKEGISAENMDTAEDLGDYLLRTAKISERAYYQKQKEAMDILDGKKGMVDSEAVKKAADMQKYSVLMSLYKKEKPAYLRLALESMINQTVPPDEIVLVEDGPLTDELYAVVDEYREYLHIVVNKINLGLGLALNNGLKECRNELVARMDTDDISKPERCEKQLQRFAEKPYLAIVGSHIDEFVGETSNVVSSRKVPTSSEDIYNYAKRRSAFNHPAVMYSKTAVLANGGYANLKRNQDVDLFGKMQFMGYKAENIDEALLWFRSSDELAKRRKSWQNTWSYIATIKKFWKMGYSSFSDYVLVAIAQMGMYLMPVKLQKFVYKNLLR